MSNPNSDEKLQELEHRISNLENKSNGGFLKKFIIWTLAIILVIFVVLAVIGVVQFVSAK